MQGEGNGLVFSASHVVNGNETQFDETVGVEFPVSFATKAIKGLACEPGSMYVFGTNCT